MRYHASILLPGDCLTQGNLTLWLNTNLPRTFFFSFHDAFISGVGIKSFIQNSLDVGVVFIPIDITPGVEIDVIRVFRVHDDEGAVLITAQNSSKEIIILKIAK